MLVCPLCIPNQANPPHMHRSVVDEDGLDEVEVMSDDQHATPPNTAKNVDIVDDFSPSMGPRAGVDVEKHRIDGDFPGCPEFAGKYVLDSDYVFAHPATDPDDTTLMRACARIKRAKNCSDALLREFKNFPDVGDKHELTLAAVSCTDAESGDTCLSHYAVAKIPLEVWNYDIHCVDTPFNLIFKIIKRSAGCSSIHTLPSSILVMPDVALAVFQSAVVARTFRFLTGGVLVQLLAPWLRCERFLSQLVGAVPNAPHNCLNTSFFRACWQLAFDMSAKWDHQVPVNNPELLSDDSAKQFAYFRGNKLVDVLSFTANASNPALIATLKGLLARHSFRTLLCKAFLLSCSSCEIRTPLLLYETARYYDDDWRGLLAFELAVRWVEKGANCGPSHILAVFAHLQRHPRFLDLVKVGISETPVMFMALLKMLLQVLSYEPDGTPAPDFDNLRIFSDTVAFFVDGSSPRHLADLAPSFPVRDGLDPILWGSQCPNVATSDFLYMFALQKTLESRHSPYDESSSLLAFFEQTLSLHFDVDAMLGLLKRFEIVSFAGPRTGSKGAMQRLNNPFGPHSWRNLISAIPTWAHRFFQHPPVLEKIIACNPCWQQVVVSSLTSSGYLYDTEHNAGTGHRFRRQCLSLNRPCVLGLEDARDLEPGSVFCKEMEQHFYKDVDGLQEWMLPLVNDYFLVLHDPKSEEPLAKDADAWFRLTATHYQRRVFLHLYFKKVCMSTTLGEEEKLAELKRVFLVPIINSYAPRGFWMLPNDDWRNKLWADRDFLLAYFRIDTSIYSLAAMPSDIVSDRAILDAALDGKWENATEQYYMHTEWRSICHIKGVKHPGLVLQHKEIRERLLHNTNTCEWAFANLEAPREHTEIEICQAVAATANAVFDAHAELSSYFRVLRGKVALKRTLTTSSDTCSKDIAQKLAMHTDGLPLPASAAIVLKDVCAGRVIDGERDKTVVDAVESVTDVRENPMLVLELLRCDQISLPARRSLFRDTVSPTVKRNMHVMATAVRMFGTAVYHYDGNIRYMLDAMPKLLREIHDLDHDGKSIGAKTRAFNTAYLRSLYIDMRDAFMPEALEKCTEKLFPRNKTMGASYRSTFADWIGLFNLTAAPVDLLESDNAAPRAVSNLFVADPRKSKTQRLRDLLKLKEDLACVTDAVASVLEPRKREATSSYPSNRYVEAFDGVRVEFRPVVEKSDGADRGKAKRSKRAILLDDDESNVSLGPPLLVTTSGSRVNIPDAWQKELDRNVNLGSFSTFWGVLFAGDGQRTKAMRLKNGKWDSLEDWEGVKLKVYDIDNDAAVPLPPFIEVVEAFDTYNEAAMLKRHRESRARGGGGITFVSYSSNSTKAGDPGRLVPYDPAGYTTYAQKIVDFLEFVPMHCLQLLENEIEIRGIDLDDEDLDDGLLPDFDNLVDTVRKTITMKPVGDYEELPRSRPEEPAKAVESTPTSVPEAAAGPSGKRKATVGYWSSSEDDDDSDVDWSNEVSSSDEE